MNDKLKFLNTVANDVFGCSGERNSTPTEFELKDDLMVGFVDIESYLIIKCDDITAQQSPKEVIKLLRQKFVEANLNIIEIATNNILKQTLQF